jgi:hypothetical protein
MNFNKQEVVLLENVIDYHSDIILNDEDDHGVIQVKNLYELLKLMREKKNG